MMDAAATAKEIAARHAVDRHIKDGMAVGLGSGSTAVYAVRALAERIEREGIKLRVAIATSKETADLARSLGIELVDEPTPDCFPLDVTIDGADEADYQLNLIKGGGGASLREKLVAVATKREIIVVHPAKRVQHLGLTFPLPVVVVPYGWKVTAARIQERMGRPVQLRSRHGQTFVTDDGLYILDVVPGPLTDPRAIERDLKAIEGVVDVGLFVGIAKLLVVGHEDGRVEEFEAL
ncbi:MAG TPA: ribose-5-phosphate isomerase RpiA [Capsulimonadaceae bacterium]|jgi:ribose 5-phosphate isomerase A